MQYLPTYCQACQRAAAIQVAGDSLHCPFCSGLNRVLPGAAYSVTDLPLFEEVEAVVYAAKLTLMQATLVVEELERSTPNVEGWTATLERLKLRLPGLESFAQVVLQHPALLQRGMGVLHCVASARKPPLARANRNFSSYAATPDIFSPVAVNGTPRYAAPRRGVARRK